MEYVLRETEFVTGVHQVHRRLRPVALHRVRHAAGLMAALNVKFGNEDVGKYSYAVAWATLASSSSKLLREQGAKVWVTDINQEQVRRCVDEYGCEAVGLDEIDVPADVYSPCALGGTVNEKTLPRLKCR